MPQPHVIVIGGPIGAGKSTIAPAVLRDYLARPDFVNADQIAAGLSAFNPEGAAFEAGRIMLQRIQELGDSRRSFAFESTLSSRSFATFLTKLKTRGFDSDLSKPRRVAEGGANRPAGIYEETTWNIIQAT